MKYLLLFNLILFVYIDMKIVLSWGGGGGFLLIEDLEIDMFYLFLKDIYFCL